VIDRPADIVVHVPGEPHAKGRHRSRVRVGTSGHVYAQQYADPKTAKFEAVLKHFGALAMREIAIATPLDCPLSCRVTAVFSIPTSKSKKWKAQAQGGLIRPTTKPDDDNLLKCRDALNGICFRDDSLFVESTVRKFYGDQPSWQIEIWRHE
jgi:Holliday junction resolvase RusA-like endonuclease